MSTEIDALREAVRNAADEHGRLSHAHDEAKWAAIKAVSAQYSPGIGEAAKVWNAAKAALDQAIADEAVRENADMYAGVLVEWAHPIIPGYFNKKDYSKWVRTGRRARHEICTPQSQFALGHKPQIGEKFLRLLKKNGTPSLKCGDSWFAGMWLPEGETPAEVA